MASRRRLASKSKFVARNQLSKKSFKRALDGVSLREQIERDAGLRREIQEHRANG
jgi:hypothetical protein